MIRVKGPRVLIRPAPEPEQDPDALIHRAEAYMRNPVVMGRVEQLGDSQVCKFCGKGRPFEVEVGDVVTFAPSSGDFVYVDDERFLILNATDITAIVERKECSMSEQVPSIGRIVHYRLSAQDAEQIMRRRTTGKSIADRLLAFTTAESYGEPRAASDGVQPVHIVAWPAGAQAHIGNEVKEGDVFPMLIVRVWGATVSSAVNGQVFLDGNDVFWATSRTVGDQPGTFSWPVRA